MEHNTDMRQSGKMTPETPRNAVHLPSHGDSADQHMAREVLQNYDMAVVLAEHIDDIKDLIRFCGVNKTCRAGALNVGRTRERLNMAPMPVVQVLAYKRPFKYSPNTPFLSCSAEDISSLDDENGHGSVTRLVRLHPGVKAWIKPYMTSTKLSINPRFLNARVYDGMIYDMLLVNPTPSKIEFDASYYMIEKGSGGIKVSDRRDWSTLTVRREGGIRLRDVVNAVSRFVETLGIKPCLVAQTVPKLQIELDWTYNRALASVHPFAKMAAANTKKLEGGNSGFHGNGDYAHYV